MTDFDAKQFLTREREFKGFIQDFRRARPNFAGYAEAALEASANSKAMKQHPDTFHGLTYMRRVYGQALPFAYGEIVQCDCGALGKVNEARIQLDGAMPADWVYIGADDLFEIWHAGCLYCDED